MTSFRFENERRTGPPDYQSRSVQTKLLGLVFALMLVIVLAVKARDPANYAWMWQLSESAESPETESADEPAAGDGAEDGPDQQPSPYVRVVNDLASALVTRVDTRTQEDLLRRVNQTLRPDRDYRIPDHSMEASAAASTEKEAEVRAEVAAYFADAFSSLPPQENMWRPVLDQLKADTDRLLTILYAAPGTAAELHADSKLVAEQIRDACETQLISLVKDNTMFERNESLAWWSLLRRATDENVENAPHATRIQLAEQPQAYRGTAVQIRGRALRGYRVGAQPNPFDVDDYWVLWLRPDGGDHLPVAVYCLELPPGFPPLTELRPDGNRLDEEVAVTGWFYKHWAYASKTGLSLAPLLVTSSPTWYPRPQPSTPESNPALTTAQFLLTGMLAVLIARVVFRWSRWKNVSRERLASESRVDQISPDDLGPTLNEAFNVLAHNDLAHNDLAHNDLAHNDANRHESTQDRSDADSESDRT